MEKAFKSKQISSDMKPRSSNQTSSDERSRSSNHTSSDVRHSSLNETPSDVRPRSSNQTSSDDIPRCSNQTSSDDIPRCSNQTSSDDIPRSSNQTSSDDIPRSSNQTSSDVRHSSLNETPSDVRPRSSNEILSDVRPRSSNQKASDVKFRSSNSTSRDVRPRSSNQTSAEVRPRSSNQTSREVRPRSSNQKSREVRPRRSNQTSRDVIPRSSNQTPSDVRPRSSNQTPSDVKPRSANQTPSDVRPRSSNQTPSDVRPRSFNQTQSDVRPRSSNQTPSDVRPRSFNQTQSDVRPRSSNQTPSDVRPRSFNQTQSDVRPRSSNQTPSDVKPKSSNQTPSDIRPRSSNQTPSDEIPISSNKTSSDFRPRSSNPTSSDERPRSSNQTSSDVRHSSLNETQSDVRPRSSNEILSDVRPRSSNQKASDVKFRSSNSTSRDVRPRSSNQTSAEVRPRSSNQTSREVRPRSSNQKSREVRPRSSNQTSREVRPRSSNQTPSDVRPRSSNQTPTDVRPRSSNQTPVDVRPRSSNQTPSDVKPRSSNQTPSDEIPRSSNQTSSDERPRSSNQTPSDVRPRSSNQTPSDVGPRSSNQTPSDVKPRSSNQTPSDVKPRSSRQTSSDVRPRSSKKTPDDVKSRFSNEPPYDVKPRFLNEPPDDVKPRFLNETQSSEKHRSSKQPHKIAGEFLKLPFDTQQKDEEFSKESSSSQIKYSSRQQLSALKPTSSRQPPTVVENASLYYNISNDPPSSEKHRRSNQSAVDVKPRSSKQSPNSGKYNITNEQLNSGKYKSLKESTSSRKCNDSDQQPIDKKYNSSKNPPSDVKLKRPYQTSNAHTHTKIKTERLTIAKLEELKHKDACSILLTISEMDCGFVQILNQPELLPNEVSLIMELVAKSCSNVIQSENIFKLLKDVETSLFMILTIPSALTKMACEVSVQTEQLLTKLIEDILDFLIELSLRIPRAITTVMGVYTIVEHSLSSIATHGMLCPDRIEMKMKQLTDAKTSVLKTMEKDRLKAISKPDITPPNDFRSILINPTYDDVYPTRPPFLRKIKAKGGFVHLDDYLDVQFRLLREDFMQPLGQGIGEYLMAADNPKQRVSVHTYHNVLVLKTEFNKERFVHTITFDIVSNKLNHIQWDHTKRLIRGTLVCLSNDKFKTFSIATVVSAPQIKQVKKRRKIDVEIFMEPVIGERVINTNMPMVMVETPVYFEAYRHVLSSLQNIREGQLPFEDYIVHCKTDVKPPGYLRDKPNIKYDFGPLKQHSCKTIKAKRADCDKLNSCDNTDDQVANTIGSTGDNCDFTDVGDVVYVGDASKGVDTILGNDNNDYDDADVINDAAWDVGGVNDDGITPILQSENEYDTNLRRTQDMTEKEQSTEDGATTDRNESVLQFNTWPQPEDLNLDLTQFEAFQQALTKEFVIIQGPPGTGKTYVGLKIVEALLTNAEIWKQDNPRPMLVVCYTNHALDQFLEGILSFHRGNLVRVGGRSKNEKVEKYGMKQMRERLHISTIWCDDKRNTYVQCQTSLLKTQEQLAMLDDGIVAETYLKDFIKKSHYETLTTNVFADYTLLVWLNLLEPVHVSTVNQKYRFCGGDKVFVNRQSQRDDSKELESLQDFRTGILQVHFRIIRSEVSQERYPDLIHQLKYKSMMTEDEAMDVNDIWALQHYNRWRLYRFWVHLLKEHLETKMVRNQQECVDAGEEYRVARLETDKAVMKRCSVIGMTTSGAARYQKVLSEIKPKIIVIEEAAEILEGHVVAALNSQCQHLILIGDHQQLRPSTNVYVLAKKYNLELSLFERMVNNGLQCICLEKQHRMRPAISRIVRHIYPGLRDDASVEDFPNIMGVCSNVFFISHSVAEETNDELKSHLNTFEANYVIALCLYFIKQGYAPNLITILTTYSAQVMYLKNNMFKEEFQGVQVTSVDNYQGEENDIILLSLVRSNLEGNVGFLKIDNRVCVALSRARKGLYVIGDFELLSKQSNLWKNIIDDLKSEGQIGPALGLYCQNHPKDSGIKASKPDDFSLAPEGGCKKPCIFRLNCGHVCARPCHPVDPGHLKYKCHKRCENLCDLGHQCPFMCYEKCEKCVILVTKVMPICKHEQQLPCSVDPIICNCLKRCEKILCDLGHHCPLLCYEDCKECDIPVTKVIPVCKHEQQVPCSVDPKDFKCRKRCEEILCYLGHQCPDLCYEACKKCVIPLTKVIPSCKHEQQVPCWMDPDDFQCMHPVMYKGACGHEAEVPCSKQGKLRCMAKCNTVLKCGHTCCGLCHECVQGRLHVPCTERCNKILICGHECQSECSTCPPCQLPCENRCAHGICDKLCGEPCTLCYHPCTWKCKDKTCIKRCFESCNRERCNKKCPLNLKCGHRCIGLCGEKCPRLCSKCNKDEVRTFLPKKKNNPNALFVELEDCGHIVEVTALDKLMNDSTASNKIQLKQCPWCKTCIRHSLRYGNVIKQTIRDINIVKLEMNERKLAIQKDFINRFLNIQNEEVDVKEDRKLYRNAIHTLQGLFAVQIQLIVLKHIRAFQRLGYHFTDRDQLEQFESQLKSFKDWIWNQRQIFSDQELSDTKNELKRLVMFIGVQIIEKQMDTDISADDSGSFELAKQLILNGNPYTPELQTVLSKYKVIFMELEREFDSFKVHGRYHQSFGKGDGELEEEDLFHGMLYNPERQQRVTAPRLKSPTTVIKTAMRFSVDHWFKCKKGHIYYLRVDRETSACPRCVVKPGLYNTRLDNESDTTKKTHSGMNRGRRGLGKNRRFQRK